MSEIDDARATILFAHGSRDPQWAAPVHALRARVTAMRPREQVCLAFLESMSPDLDTAVAQVVASGARVVRIAPLFLGQGAHVRRDLAARVAAIVAAHPEIAIEVLPSLGESESVLTALAHWVAD